MNDIQKSYSPEEIENRWYAYWEEQGHFRPPDDGQGLPYCIVIPPPNVTGTLHMGHALNATVQDILIRWKRMSGLRALWLPGTDHAGIATQNVVERSLLREGLDRHRLGREEFIKRVWQWRSEYGGKIIHQLKKLGASCDWSRERFTMDEGLSRAVREVFVRLFDEGLIYRDNRLINWCPRCHTALSDLEVEYEEMEGTLSFIRYPLDGRDGHVIVATTRPETMLGDTAIAAHPEDERYAPLRDSMIRLPLTERLIPLVADASVDPSFGTGAVKVTPAHDFSDEAIGKRQGLRFINVMTEDGKMSGEAGPHYAGLDRYECRKKVVQDLAALGLLERESRHRHAVGHCYRCKTIIEPFMTVQWYVRVATLAKEAVKVVEEDRIRIIPETWRNNYYGWMRDIKDWCISRQIWWGHQIPVWYCPHCMSPRGEPQGSLIEHIFYEPVPVPGGEKGPTSVAGGVYADLRAMGFGHEDIIRHSRLIRIPKEIVPLCGRDEIIRCPTCGTDELIRDPDVLDTWFSSALWPFSTLGWPDETDDMKTFYPTSVLVTGFDILFFWVARMIMMGLKFGGDVPFRDVYIHALVRDLKGKKMSKSKGNVIDPLVMIEKYGADAFRFTLAAFAAQGRDVRFSEERVEGYRFFINKLWNAAKFIASYGALRSPEQPVPQGGAPDLPSGWILSRLGATVEEVNLHLEAYRFNEAAGRIYQFVWHEFCDWYIEVSKPVLYQGEEWYKRQVVDCLFHVLGRVLQLLHPFMPFVTEDLWRSLFDDGCSIMTSPYPRDSRRDYVAEEKMGWFIDGVSGIRSIRGELNIPPSLEIVASIKTKSAEVEEVLRANLEALRRMTRCGNVSVGTAVTKERGSAVSVKEALEIYVPIEGILDVDKEVRRLEKERAKIDQSLTSTARKLANDDFLASAPPEVIEKEKDRAEELAHKRERIEENIRLLGTITK